MDQPKPRLPEGMSEKEFWELHCMPDMVKHRNENWNHIQLGHHRAQMFPAVGKPANSRSSLAANLTQGRRHNELDGVLTKDQEVAVLHDFHAKREAGINAPVGDLMAKQIIGVNMTISKFQQAEFAPEVIIAADTIQEIFELIQYGLKLDPTATFYADLRNEQCAPFTAKLSLMTDEIRDHVIMMFYTFDIVLAADLVRQVESFHHHPDWKVRTHRLLNFYPIELITVASRLGMPSDTCEQLLDAGKAVMNSYIKEQVPLFGLLAMNSGLTQADFPDFDNLTKDERQNVLAEEAMVKLVNWSRNNAELPNLKIGSGTRAYDCCIRLENGQLEFYTFDLMTSALIPWPESGPLRDIKKLYATPGVCERVLHPDLMITDAPEKAALYCCGIEADDSNGYRHPQFDLVISSDN